MPYIKKANRNRFSAVVKELNKLTNITAGDVNYLISKILNRMVHFRNEPSYAMLNSLIGVLECVKLELYRRIVVPYEEEKIEENGDIYE